MGKYIYVFSYLQMCSLRHYIYLLFITGTNVLLDDISNKCAAVQNPKSCYLQSRSITYAFQKIHTIKVNVSDTINISVFLVLHFIP